MKGPSDHNWCYIFVRGQAATSWRDSFWELWNVSDDYHAATIPVIQNVSKRPSDDNPITGNSVNE